MIIKTDNESVLLLCKALWKSSHCLQEILPFFQKDRLGSKKDENLTRVVQQEKLQQDKLREMKY